MSDELRFKQIAHRPGFFCQGSSERSEHAPAAESVRLHMLFGRRWIRRRVILVRAWQRRVEMLLRRERLGLHVRVQMIPCSAAPVAVLHGRRWRRLRTCTWRWTVVIHTRRSEGMGVERVVIGHGIGRIAIGEVGRRRRAGYPDIV